MLLSRVCKFFLFLPQESFLFIDTNKNNIWQGLPRSSVSVIFFIITSNISHDKLVSLGLNEIEGVCLYLL